MNRTDLLDDNLEWDKIWSENDMNALETTEPRPVRMLKTFNTDEQAQLAAATLRGSGIATYVVSAATSGMTPFAYGNFRLFVAESQADEAAELLSLIPKETPVETEPKGSMATFALVGVVTLGILIVLSLLYFWRS